MTNHNQVIRPGEVTAGEGYRLLEPGELMQGGDEYFFAGNWLPSQRHSREQHPLYAYRRPVCEKAAEDTSPAKPRLDPGEGWRLLEDGEIVRDGDEARSFATDWWEVSSPGRTLTQYIDFRPGVVAVRRRIEPEFIDLQPGMQVTIPIEATDLSRILDALDGDNPDQRRIAEVGLSLVAMVLRKNTDYQNSAWQVPRFAKHLDARTAILVRMGDKVARLERILANDAQVTDEPAEATVGDLAGYAIVLMAAPKETGQ